MDFSTFSASDIEKWANSSQVSFRETVKSSDALDVWNKCFEAVNFPHKKELKKCLTELLKKTEEDDIALPENGKCAERIANKSTVESFLGSIKDWKGWDDGRKLYATGKTNDDGDIAWFNFDDWEKYQEWRFEQYFLRGNVLPPFNTDPIEACKQGYAKWREICTWE